MPYLLKQHPQLAKVETNDSEISKSSYKFWLIEQIVMYGRELPVKPLPKNVYHGMRPIEEAIWLRGSDDDVYIVTDDEIL